MTIKRGSIVWLKSGGPKMTVMWEGDYRSSWVCTWFNEKDEVKEYIFPEPALTEEDPNDYDMGME